MIYQLLLMFLIQGKSTTGKNNERIASLTFSGAIFVATDTINPYIIEMAKQLDFKRKIYNNINTGHILDALALLKEIFTSLRDYNGLDRTERVRSTYFYLLKFLKEGVPDPQRHRVLSEIKEDICDLAGYAERISNIPDSSELYYTRARLAEFSGLNYSEALGRYLSADAAQQLTEKGSDDYHNSLTSKNIALQDIFTIIWTMPTVGSNADTDSIINVATDPDISFSLRAIIVGALIMSLLNNYDRVKFNALLSIESGSDDEKIKARALIGIALILDSYPNRISKDPYLAERFETMADDLTFYTRMREVIYSLVKARGGLNYLNRIKKEIIPDIQKLGPDIVNRMKDAEGNINIERLEENPEWDRLMEKSGLEKKLRRLNNMQSSGADMMLSMFEQASNNSFYKDIDSWFRPFLNWEAERLGVPEDMFPLIEMFELNNAICDSDKFAMVSNMNRLPESARNLLRSTFEAQASQLTEEMKSMMLHTSSPEFDMECYNYARVLFRFFTFFRLRSEFKNPFRKALRFDKWPFISRMFSEKEILSSVGDFYYRQGFMEDAIDVFTSLRESDRSDEWNAFCLQKIGCALSHLGRNREALKVFIEAFTLAPEDEWLAGKLVSIAAKENSFPVECRDALLMLYKKDKNNLNYLLPLARFEVSGWNYVGPEGKKAKFLERAAYIAPDNTEVIFLLIARELGCNDIEKNYPKLIKMLQPSLDNVNMYLASLSLSENLQDTDITGHTRKGMVDPDDSVQAKDLYEMRKVTLLAAYLHFLMGEQKECISQLHNLTDISSGSLDSGVMLEDLRQILSGIAIDDGFKEILPVMIDSLGIG